MLSSIIETSNVTLVSPAGIVILYGPESKSTPPVTLLLLLTLHDVTSA